MWNLGSKKWKNPTEDNLWIKLTHLVLQVHINSVIHLPIFQTKIDIFLQSQIGKHFLYNSYKWLI